MRMQTTNYFLLCVVMLLGIGNIQAQDTVMTKVKTTSLQIDTMMVERSTPLIDGLPAFYVNFETSLRAEPDHKSDVKIRLFPGMKVEVLDPYNYLYWTQVKVGEKIGWAKKACLDPESGEIDHSKFLEGKSWNL